MLGGPGGFENALGALEGGDEVLPGRGAGTIGERDLVELDTSHSRSDESGTLLSEQETSGSGGTVQEGFWKSRYLRAEHDVSMRRSFYVPPP